MTVIEQSDRGITLTKGLAWTMLGGIFGGGLWLGVQLATLSSSIEGQAGSLTQLQAQIAAGVRTQNELDDRVRRLESQQARSDERYSSILSYLARIDTRLERIEQRP